MNIEFKILWFEDEVAWYNMEKIRIDSILSDHSLTPSIIRKNGNDFDVSELTSNEYDLILMDFKLAGGMTGDIIVKALRENDILTDILFYSSEEEAMLHAIQSKMPPIDGVYLTKRDYIIFTEKIGKLIGKIVRRSEDIVNLRGFVLDQTSDFEVRIKSILNVCWQKFDKSQKSVLTDTVTKLLDGKQSYTKKMVESAKSADDIFPYANNDKRILSIADRLDIFQETLPILFEGYSLPDEICPSNFKEYYTDKVSVYRNSLGHISLDEKIIKIKGKDIKIDQDLHRLLRNNIIEVNHIIEKIETHILHKM